jgi:hypothetical protein
MFYLYKLRTAAALLVLMLMAGGCLKDTCDVKTPSRIYTPIYKSLAEIRSGTKMEGPRALEEAGKIYVYGTYIFVNEPDKGIHVIDNTDPAAPRNIAFIAIPGNIDLAIKGNILYADSYVDLVVFNIADPGNIHEVSRVPSAFSVISYQYGIYTDTSKGVIVGFNEKDTVLTNTCNLPDWRGEFMYFASSNSAVVANSSKSGSPVGKAGSTAKFGLLNNYLYTVNNSRLHTFDIGQLTAPQWKSVTSVPAMVETIFPYKDHLYFGTTTGLFIFDVANPEQPAYKGIYSHVTSCDPVVVENDIAYVTLRSGRTCGANVTDQLDVIDVKNPAQPVLKKTYQMSSPYGLGIDEGKLFVCEGSNGLRFLDAADPMNIKTLATAVSTKSYDVIPQSNKVLLVTGPGGIYQYDYSDMANPKLLSKIAVKNSRI